VFFDIEICYSECYVITYTLLIVNLKFRQNNLSKILNEPKHQNSVVFVYFYCLRSLTNYFDEILAVYRYNLHERRLTSTLMNMVRTLQDIVLTIFINVEVKSFVSIEISMITGINIG
jgi:hypothetical protein